MDDVPVAVEMSRQETAGGERENHSSRADVNRDVDRLRTAAWRLLGGER
jgi:hypothetical protein